VTTEELSRRFCEIVLYYRVKIRVVEKTTRAEEEAAFIIGVGSGIGKRCLERRHGGRDGVLLFHELFARILERDR